MADNTVVTELVIESNPAGADGYVAAMNKASSAANATVAANDKIQASIARQTVTMTGGVASQAAQFTRLALAADPVLAATQKLEKATLTGAAAMAAGKATQEEVNNVTSIYAARVAAAAAGTAVNTEAMTLSSLKTRELSTALEQMGMGLATGRASFSSMSHEGLMLVRALGEEGGVAAALGAVGATAVELLVNPVTWMIAGFIAASAAASALWSAIDAGSTAVASDLKAHDEAIKAIKAEWDAASKSASQYGQQAQLSINFQGNADKLRMQLLASQQQPVMANTLAPVPLLGDPNSAFNQLATTQAYIDKYGVLAQAVQAFAQAAAKGKGDVLAFNSEIEKIALSDPSNTALTTMVLGLLNVTDAATKAAMGLRDTNAELAKTDLQKIAGLAQFAAGAAEAAAMNKTANALADAQREREAALAGLGATTPQQKADAASATVLAKPQDYATDPTGAIRQYEAGTAAAVAYKQAILAVDQKAAQAAASDQKNFDAALKSTQKQTDALTAEAAELGLSAGAAAEMKKQQELIDLAEQDHQARTPALLASINAQAKAYGDATAALQRMKDAQQAEQFLGQSLFDAATGATSLSDAFAKLADSIAKAVEQALLLGTGPLAGIFGTTSSSGGLLGSLFSSILGVGGGSSAGLLGHNANGNAFDAGSNVIPFARGGIVDHPTLFKFASGTGLMGEAGPEAIMPLKRGANGQLGVQMVPANANSRGSNVSVGVTINSGGGEDPEALATAASALVKKHIKDALTAENRALPDKVYTIMRNPRRRGTAALPSALTGAGR